jgi:predicted NAD/FAD-dependent oxidoreductase
MRNVAIIGAGMAGLSAAERLRAAGHGVTLFEKSRGFGGRMATRRSGDFQFDHGAQYFTARGADFFRQISDWQAQGLVAEWGPGSYVGRPGMTAPARAMAKHHTCITQALVTRLERNRDGWRVMDEHGLIEAPGNGAYDAVILAVPAPQAIPLAQSAGAYLPQLAHAQYAPCIALMLAYEPETRATADNWMRPEDSVIGWIAKDSSKPGRPHDMQTWVVHARADWSRAHLDQDPQISGEILHAHFKALSGIDATPLYSSAHRWRYALVEQEVGLPCLFDESRMIGACGDWCLGPRVEAAYESGRAMGDMLIEALAEIPA